MSIAPTIEDVALDWAVRVPDPDFGDWEGLTAWLDGDPARNLAYNRAVAAVAAAVDEATAAGDADAAIESTIVPCPSRTGKSRRGWVAAAGGLAVAAGVAGVLIVGRPLEKPAWRAFEAPPKRGQTIALTDGSRIDIVGGSRLLLDPSDARSARLVRGRALFTVRHDSARPFQVAAGGYRIVDAGTIFEVTANRERTDVAVAEGLVIVDPGRAALRLEPGKAADFRAGRAPVIRSVVPGNVGQWRNPRMSYRDAPFSLVAADLSAALGQVITVDPAIATRRFDGTLTPANLRGRPDEVAALLDVRLEVGAQGWELRAR